LLRASDLSPVNYKRVAEADGKEAPWDQIVKGYEYEKGKFVVLKDDDFKRVDLEATQTVDIIDFVALSEINPMFFHKPFYLEPDKYKDDYHSALLKLIHQKVESGDRKPARKLAPAKGPGNIVDLTEVLRQSLRDTAKHARGKRRSAGPAKAARKQAA
jgi:non-homologous end joining protein Ku